MNRTKFLVNAIGITVLTLTFVSAAQAQATRTFISGVGNDADPCSRTAPCRTWSGAFIKTFIGGEINALDPGGYGTLNITKSITLDGAGTHASTLASGTTGININIAVNANDPFRQVILRNLSINGAGASGTVGTRTGLNGIRLHTSGALNVMIENTIIQNFSQNGIDIDGASGVKFDISNTQIRNCTGAGISADTSSGLVRVAVRDSSMTNCATGVLARRNSRVGMIHCTITSNSVGLLVEGNGGTAVAVLESCLIANNTSHGVQVGSAAATNVSVARLSENMISSNGGAGASIQTNGSVETFGTNKIIGNTPDGCVGCVSVSSLIN